MCIISFFVLLAALTARVLSVELAAVYKNDILILNNSSLQSNSIPIPATSLKIHILRTLTYPVAIEYNPLKNHLLVSDIAEEVSSIHSINLFSGPSYDVQPLFKKISLSIIDSLVYDLSSKNLIWRDSNAYKPGIYKLNINKEYIGRFDEEKLISFPNGATEGTSGLAVDYCKGQVYWALKNRNHSELRISNLNGSVSQILRETENFYRIQGIAYNVQMEELIWVEVFGNITYGTCTFYRQVARLDVKVLTKLEDCYPFSLATDGIHIYWSDWAREGIMRMTIADPKEVTKLVHCPSIESAGGFHLGAFEVVLLSNITYEAVCGDMLSQVTTSSSSINGAEHFSDHNIFSAISTSLSAKNSSSGNNVHVSFDSPSGMATFPSLHQDVKLKNATPLDNSSTYQLEENSTAQYHFHSDCQIANCTVLAEWMWWNISDWNCERSVHALFGMTGLCVLLVICIGVLFCYIRILKCRSRSEVIHVNPPPHIGKRRRKVHKYFSGLESGQVTRKPQTCSKNSSDGVHIAIEDCCQMTLCETPCYTSVQKEGRSYLDSSKKSEDKSRLLDAEF